MYILLVNSEKKRPLTLILIFSMILLLSVLTTTRANDWRSMTSHAISEVTNHPKSERANFQMARVYSKMYEINKDPRFAKQAALYYHQAALLNTKESGALIGLLQLQSLMQQKVEPQTIDNLIDRLKNQPMSPANISFLNSLSKCSTEGFCKLSTAQLQLLYDAANNNPTTNDTFKSLLDGNLAVFYAKQGNFTTAEQYILSAIKNNPDSLNHYNAATFYFAIGNPKQSDTFLKKAIALDKNKTLSREIEGLKMALKKVENDKN